MTHLIAVVYDGCSKKRHGAVANIIDSSKDAVWGGLFLINKDNLAALDWHEGYPNSYDRKAVDVIREDFLFIKICC